MCKREIKEFDAKLKAYGKQVTSSKESSEEFLQKIGVLTKNGDLTRHYKNLCTQQGRD